MRQFAILLSLSVLLLFSATPLRAGSIVIDDLQAANAQMLYIANAGAPRVIPPDPPGDGIYLGPWTQQVPGAGILGGFRDTNLTGTISALNHSISLGVGGGSAVYQASDASFGILTLTYDGNGAGLPTLEGNTIIQVPFSAVDPGLASSLDVSVTITDRIASGGDSHTILESPTTAGTVSFDFTDFAGAGAGLLNFDDLASIVFQFSPDPANGGGVDFSITQPIIATAVPEPGAVALLGMFVVLGTVIGSWLIPSRSKETDAALVNAS